MTNNFVTNIESAACPHYGKRVDRYLTITALKKAILQLTGYEGSAGAFGQMNRAEMIHVYDAVVKMKKQLGEDTNE